MNTAAKFKDWRDQHEAALELSEKTGIELSSADALRCALDRGVPFVVNVPSGTPDCQGRHIMERGLWELMTEGARGESGRRQIESEINPGVSLWDIGGAWVERRGVQRQLRPLHGSDFPRGGPDYYSSVIPSECTLGFRRQVVEDLAETLIKELAEEKPTPDALDEPLGERERTTLLAIIAALAKKAKIDVSHSSAAAGRIEEMTGRLGVRVAARTAENHLKKVRKLLDERGTPPD